MKIKIKFYIIHTVLALALAGAASIITKAYNLSTEKWEINFIILGAFLITGLAFYLFIKDLNKGAKKAVLGTLLAIAIKFLLYLTLIGIYALVSKNITKEFLIIFFIIYLLNTSHLLITFVTQLKSNKQSVSDVKEK